MLTKDDIMINLYTSLKESEVPLEIIAEIIGDISGGIKDEYGTREGRTKAND